MGRKRRNIVQNYYRVVGGGAEKGSANVSEIGVEWKMQDYVCRA